MFYTAIEALTIGVMSANAPYGTTYTSPAPPLFATPFITAASGQNLGQVFPVTLAPLNSSASHPDSSVDWSQFEPITGTAELPHHQSHSLHRGIHALARARIGSQYRAQLQLRWHAGASSAGARRSEPRRSLACVCILSNPANLAPGQTPCGPFGEDSTYITSTGHVYNGTRGPLGSNFGSNANQATIGNSNYNALQITLRHTSKRLNVLAGYTYSKSQDQSSNIGEEVNPLDPSLSKALSSFDVRHNFVVSYTYQLPFERLFRASNRWTQGWEISGITHFSTRPARDARQLRRQFPAGIGAERHQQLWRRRTGLHRRPSRSESQSAQRAALFQYRPIQRERSGHAGQPPSGASSTAPEWTISIWRF